MRKDLLREVFFCLWIKLPTLANPIKNVGGGLLPMAVDQLIHVLTDSLLSGASPLPQGDLH
ncbi:hypothetical protein C4J98_0321 [Pseudomonas orientalis]|nr:hypothetical protein C4J98_0321 [Pseudomonas orientalis]